MAHRWICRLETSNPELTDWDDLGYQSYVIFIFKGRFRQLQKYSIVFFSALTAVKSQEPRMDAFLLVLKVYLSWRSLIIEQRACRRSIF